MDAGGVIYGISNSLRGEGRAMLVAVGALGNRDCDKEAHLSPLTRYTLIHLSPVDEFNVKDVT